MIKNFSIPIFPFLLMLFPLQSVIKHWLSQRPKETDYITGQFTCRGEAKHGFSFSTQINKILVEEGIGTLILFSRMSALISAIKSIFLEERFS